MSRNQPHLTTRRSASGQKGNSTAQPDSTIAPCTTETIRILAVAPPAHAVTQEVLAAQSACTPMPGAMSMDLPVLGPIVDQTQPSLVRPRHATLSGTSTHVESSPWRISARNSRPLPYRTVLTIGLWHSSDRLSTAPVSSAPRHAHHLEVHQSERSREQSRRPFAAPDDAPLKGLPKIAVRPFPPKTAAGALSGSFRPWAQSVFSGGPPRPQGPRVRGTPDLRSFSFRLFVNSIRRPRNRRSNKTSSSSELFLNAMWASGALKRN